MEQVSSEMNFLPTDKSTFVYTTGEGYTLNCDALRYCNSSRISATRYIRWCTILGTCEKTCGKKETCKETCGEKETCKANTCIVNFTCEDTCGVACTLDTCFNTCFCTVFTCNYVCNAPLESVMFC
jgi:hypothetical protein